MASNHGRKVKAVYWPDSEAEEGRCLIAGEYGCGELEIVNDFHGEYDIDWVVEIRDGKEVASHNTRFVESILWAGEEAHNAD